jgi:hypothetical protein
MGRGWFTMGKQGKPAGNMGAAQFSRQKIAAELLESLMANSSYTPQDKNKSQKGQTTDSEWLCKSCEKNNFLTRRVPRVWSSQGHGIGGHHSVQIEQALGEQELRKPQEPEAGGSWWRWGCKWLTLVPCEAGASRDQKQELWVHHSDRHHYSRGGV